MENINTEVLNLFGGVIGTKGEYREINNRLFNRGIFVDPQYDVSDVEDLLIQYHKTHYDKSFRDWNSTANKDIQDLVLEQLLHYGTTYGYEELGIEGDVFYPFKELDVPNIYKTKAFKNVRVYSEDEVHALLMKLISQNVAFSDSVLLDIMTLLHYFGDSYMDLDELISHVGNRELVVRIYDYFNEVPSDPVNFLRFLVYVTTKETLIIKNRDLIEKIKASDMAIDKYLENAPWNLASIFFRYKPLFLAFKSISNNKTFFNRLRKKANKLHIPMKGRVIDNISSTFSLVGSFSVRDAFAYYYKIFSAESVSVYRLVRIYNYLISELKSQNDGKVYRIRNGKIFARSGRNQDVENYPDECVFVLNVLEAEIRSRLLEPVLYIPDGIRYAVPTSQKQFMGNFPIGSVVDVENGVTVGVSWENKPGRGGRVDLDLSLMTKAGKVGWNGAYRTSSSDVLYSGDVTDAEHGATEAIRVEGEAEGFVTLNYYNADRWDDEDVADYTFFVAGYVDLHSKMIVDPNDVILSAKLQVRRQDTMGFLTGNYFVLDNYKGMNNVSSRSEHDEFVVGHVQNTLLNRLYLDDLFETTDDPELADINLSPNDVSIADFLALMEEVA